MRPLALLAFLPSVLGAQGALFIGRVLVDGTDAPIAGATISIDALHLSTTADSLGRFRLVGVQPGSHTVSVKHLGHAAFTSRFNFDPGDSVDVDLLMAATAQRLPPVGVKGARVLPPKMVEFEERRLAGNGGQFLTDSVIAKREGWPMADIMRQVPGLELIRSNNSSAWYVAAGRMSQPAGALAGVGGKCYAAVAIDGAFVYTGEPGQPRFDINSIEPSSIAGIEYYAGAASMPAKYNATRGTCALLLIWTK